MLCTECSSPVRPVVAIDIDGTLGDYHSHFLEFAELYLGVMTDVGREAYTGWEGFRQWFTRVYKVSERTWHDIKLAYRQGAQKRSMPIYDGATELCHGVRDAGAELWLTTTRPYLRLDNIDPDTRFWLDLHGIKGDGLLYDELKYQRLAELVEPERVVAVVDDLPDMFDAAAKLFGYRVPILRQTQYNKAVKADDATAYQSLETIRIEVVVRINYWKENHDPSNRREQWAGRANL